MRSEIQNASLNALQKLIASTKISGDIDIKHLRGNPEDIIPSYILENNVDILIMGTVARTGVYSFIIGNTAENILQQINCTLVALKPNGFVSPVKAY